MTNAAAGRVLGVIGSLFAALGLLGCDIGYMVGTGEEDLGAWPDASASASDGGMADGAHVVPDGAPAITIDAHQAPPDATTSSKEIGFIFETSKEPAVVQSITFEKNGETKTFKVIDSNRVIQAPIKIFTKVSEQWVDFSNKPIVQLGAPDGEPKPCYGGGSWSTKMDYIFVTRFENYPNHEPWTGKLTLLWPANSEMGQWIQGSKVKYRFRTMDWNRTATIKLVGITSETSTTDDQRLVPAQSGIFYKETDLGMFPK